MSSTAQSETRAFAAAFATGEDWRSVAKEALRQLGPKPRGTLGLIYLTDALAEDSSSIVMLLRAATGIDLWVGASGIGVCACGREAFDRPALSILVLDLPADAFCCTPCLDRDEIAGFADQIGGWLKAKQPMLGLVHGRADLLDIQQALADFTAATQSHLIGGIASGGRHSAVISEVVSEQGFGGVLFAADQPVVTGLTQGCMPVGEPHQVTEHEDNIIAMLDGRPAFEVFSEDMRVLAETIGLTRRDGDVHAGVLRPGAARDDYLVRNLMGIDPDRGMMAIGDFLDAEDRIQFVWRSAETVKTDLNRMLDDIVRRLDGVAPRGGVYISCLARGPNAFGRPHVEMQMIKAALGDVPIAGFFANGEISGGRLYSYTGVLTLFL